jgi:hypothetical protein
VIFSNTELFKIQALEFLKTGTYNTDPYGSPAWIEFWTKELEYCKNGYSVGDVKITGDHYFYLNYCQIKRTDDERVREKTNKSKKWADKGKPSFPDFWDGDYDYFWAKEIARKGISLEDYKKLGLSIKIKEEHLSGGKHLIVAKARRKGFSYKNAAIAVNNYNSNKTSLTVIGAYEKKFLYPKGTMSMASYYMDFLNEHTGWSKKRDFVNKTEHKKASYKFTDAQGNIIEKGYKSEIIAVTFMDNPDAARGKDSNLILMEEAGAFSNLKASFAAVDPLTKSGSLRTGQILVFGTGGDMEAGTLDFEDMFYDPDAYNMLAFENQWDDNFGKTFCGFYFPDKKNKDGFIDKNGNSDEAGAEAYEEIQRENLRRNAKDKKALDRYIVEYSNKPKETFLRIKGNIFPTIELQRVLGTLEAAKDENNYWIGDLLSDENGKIEWKPNKNLRPILEFPIKDKTADTTGAVIIYEPPFEGAEGVPYGMYIASCDPYDHDKSQSGSLGSTLIYNRLTKRIVAEYTARPETSKEYYEVVRKLLIYYNAKCLYENEKKGIFDYFDYQNCTYLLADQPECIKDVIQKSTVQRGKGLHMNKELKDYGEGLIKTDLIEAYDERNPELKNMHKIRSQPLLKELIAYDGEINTDRVMAYMLLMYYKLELRKYKVDTQTEIKEIKDSDFFNANHYQRRKRNFR